MPGSGGVTCVLCVTYSKQCPGDEKAGFSGLNNQTGLAVKSLILGDSDGDQYCDFIEGTLEINKFLFRHSLISLYFLYSRKHPSA